MQNMQTTDNYTQLSFKENSVITSTTLLGASLSMKPLPGQIGSSAARNILSQTLGVLKNSYHDVSLIDIRDYPLPFFSGTHPHQLNDYNCNVWINAIKNAGSLFISVPAYWSGISGVSKNYFDVLCGPSYNYKDNEKNIFFGKKISILIVAADSNTSEAALQQMQHLIRHLECELIGDPIVIVDPRSNPITDNQMQEILLLSAQLAKATLLSRTI